MHPAPPQATAASHVYPNAVVDAFIAQYGRQPEVVVRAPGRVTMLGAHVDYSEGWVITGAIDRAVWLAAAPASGSRVRIQALDVGETATLDLAGLPPPLPQRRGEKSTWIDYPAGIAWALSEAGKSLLAMDATFGGNLPIGAGVSSSAAVEIAFLLAWEALQPADAGLVITGGAAQARLGMRAENGYVGVQSGIMDQFSSVHGAAGQLIFLDCRTLDFEHLPLPAATSVLVADSGISHQLADSGPGDRHFNDRRRQCSAAVEILKEGLPGIRTLRDVSTDDFALHRHLLPSDLRRRVQHAVEECRRVHTGVAALRAGDLDAFGRLMRQSHRSSRDLYQVSIPEIDLLASSAWAVPGCHGARLLGGGFGGCVVALVESAAVEPVRRAMTLAFEQEFGRPPKDIFTCSIDDGAGLE